LVSSFNRYVLSTVIILPFLKRYVYLKQYTLPYKSCLQSQIALPIKKEPAEADSEIQSIIFQFFLKLIRPRHVQYAGSDPPAAYVLVRIRTPLAMLYLLRKLLALRIHILLCTTGYLLSFT